MYNNTLLFNKAYEVDYHSVRCNDWIGATYYSIWNRGTPDDLAAQAEMIEWMRDQFGPPGDRWLYEIKHARLNLVIRGKVDGCAFKLVHL